MYHLDKIMSVNTNNSLKIAWFNIQGSVDKKVDSCDFQSIISGHDIVCLQETWLVESSTIHIKAYEIYRSERSKYNRRRMSVIFRQHHKRGLNKFKIANSDFL